MDKNQFEMTRPKHCRVCGSTLVLIEEPDGFWEDNGERRFYRWYRCPNWKGGRTMVPEYAFISYTSLPLTRNQDNFENPMLGYTRYQTCDYTVIY